MVVSRSESGFFFVVGIELTPAGSTNPLVNPSTFVHILEGNVKKDGDEKKIII